MVYSPVMQSETTNAVSRERVVKAVDATRLGGKCWGKCEVRAGAQSVSRQQVPVTASYSNSRFSVEQCETCLCWRVSTVRKCFGDPVFGLVQVYPHVIL